MLRGAVSGGPTATLLTPVPRFAVDNLVLGFPRLGCLLLPIVGASAIGRAATTTVATVAVATSVEAAPGVVAATSLLLGTLAGPMTQLSTLMTR